MHIFTCYSRFGQSQPSMFGSSQQQQPQQQQQQNQLTIFGATSQQQQQPQQQSSVFSFQQPQQQHGPLSAYAAAQMAPASQEVVAIAQAFSKDSAQYPFRHLFLNVVDDPRRYGRPQGNVTLHLLFDMRCAFLQSTQVCRYHSHSERLLSLLAAFC